MSLGSISRRRLFSLKSRISDLRILSCARFLQNRDRETRLVAVDFPPDGQVRNDQMRKRAKTFQQCVRLFALRQTSRSSTLFVLFVRADKANVKPFIARRMTKPWSHATRPRRQTMDP